VTLRPSALRVLTHLVNYPGEDDVEAIAEATRRLPRLERPPRTDAEWQARAAFVTAFWRAARTEVTTDLRELARLGLVERCRGPELGPGVAARIETAAADYREHWREYTRCLGWERRPTVREAWLLGAERVVRAAVLVEDDGSEDVTGTDEFPTYAVLLSRISKGPPTVRKLLGRNPDGHTKRVWASLCAAGLCRAPSQRWPTETGVAVVERARRGVAA
jgi:hypothetical protein